MQSETSSENSEMSSVSEASLLVRRVAEPREVGDSVKAAIRRAAGRLGFSYSRTKGLWYGDARRIESTEMDRLRDEATRVEARIHRDRLLALCRALAATDEEFHRETIAHLERALRAMGCDVGTLVLRDGE